MRTVLFTLFLSLTCCPAVHAEELVKITWECDGVKIEASIAAGQEEAFLRHVRAIRDLQSISPAEDDPFWVPPPQKNTRVYRFGRGDRTDDLRDQSMNDCMWRVEGMQDFIDRLLINEDRLSELIRTLRMLTDELRRLNQDLPPRHDPSSFNTAL